MDQGLARSSDRTCACRAHCLTDCSPSPSTQRSADQSPSLIQWQAGSPLLQEPESDDGARTLEVRLGDAERVERRAERRERAPHTLGVLGDRVEVEIEILRAARHAVCRESVRADHQESCARIEQCEDAVEPIPRHARRITFTGMCARSYCGTGLPLSSHMRALSSQTISTRSAAVVVADRSSPGSSPGR